MTSEKILLGLLALVVLGGGIGLLMRFGPFNHTPARITFLISGRTEGFLENCGCSGGQSGGVHRRATMIRSKREEVAKPIVSDDGHASESITLDTGDFSDSSDARQVLRSKGIVKAMDMTGYDSVGLGQNELTFNQKDLLDLLKQGPSLPYTCANLKFIKPTDSEDNSQDLAKLVKPYQIVHLKSGYKVGIIHVLDNSAILRGEPIKTGYVVDSPVDAVAKVLKEHGGEAPFWVLSVGTNEQFGLRNEKLQDFDQIKLVFGMRGYQPEGGTDGVAYPYFVDKPMEKGKDETVVGVTFAENNQLRITALKVGIREDSYKKAKDVEQMIEALKPEEEKIEQKRAEDALKNHPVDVPLYIGFQNCSTCHRDIAVQLASSMHMEAYSTLHKLGQEHNACAQCHNNGFNKPGGFNVIEDAKYTGDWVQRNVQCETCHGPGEYHVKLHQNKFKHPKLSTDGRDKEGLLPVNRDTCVACHTPEQSPHFDFDKYWPYIQHGKGLKPKQGHPEGAGMGPQSNPSATSNQTSLNDRRDRVIASLHAML